MPAPAIDPGTPGFCRDCLSPAPMDAIATHTAKAKGVLAA